MGEKRGIWIPLFPRFSRTSLLIEIGFIGEEAGPISAVWARPSAPRLCGERVQRDCVAAQRCPGFGCQQVEVQCVNSRREFGSKAQIET